MYAYTHIRICTHKTLALLAHSRLAWLIMYFCEIECFRVEFYKCLPCTYIRVYARTQTAHGLPRDLNAPWRDKHRKGQVSAQSTPQGKLGDLSHSSQYVELASEVHFSGHRAGVNRSLGPMQPPRSCVVDRRRWSVSAQRR